MEAGDQLIGFTQRQVQARGQLVLAHAVHQAQADRLGRLASEPGHVRNHLVEVGVGVVVVGIDHGAGTGQAQEAGIVHQEARLLRAEVV